MMPIRRYGALEMLADHLNRSRGYGAPAAAPQGPFPSEFTVPQEMWDAVRRSRQPAQPALPPGLPDVVQESIREAPSYDEGQMQQPLFAAPWQGYSDFEREQQLMYPSWQLGQGREGRLVDELNFNRAFPSMGYPLPDSWQARPNTEPRYSRPNPNLGLGGMGALF